LLVIFTGVVLLSGVALLVVGPERPGLVLSAHKLSFVIWFALMALHVLGHVKDALVLSRWDWLPRADRARPRGKGQRRGLVALSVLAGVALGAALLPVASPWTNRQDLGRHSRNAGAARYEGAVQVSSPIVQARESLWP
jgi:hypothetical protein